MLIGLLYKTIGPDSDISKLSAERISSGLFRLKHKVRYITFNPSNLDIYSIKDCDLVFNLVYGEFGEDGIASGILEAIKVPFIGPDLITCLLSYNKEISKHILRQNNIRVPKSASKPPLFYKPKYQGSSFKIGVAQTLNELKTVRSKKNYFFEEFLEGREFSATIISDRGKLVCLPTLEIQKSGDFLSKKQKYFSEKGFVKGVLGSDKNLKKEIENYCIKVFAVFRCLFYAKLDIVLGKSNKPYVVEFDAMPGFGPNSILPLAAEKTGITFENLLNIFIYEATRKFKKTVI